MVIAVYEMQGRSQCDNNYWIIDSARLEVHHICCNDPDSNMSVEVNSADIYRLSYNVYESNDYGNSAKIYEHIKIDISDDDIMTLESLSEEQEVTVDKLERTHKIEIFAESPEAEAEAEAFLKELILKYVSYIDFVITAE